MCGYFHEAPGLEVLSRGDLTQHDGVGPTTRRPEQGSGGTQLHVGVDSAHLAEGRLENLASSRPRFSRDEINSREITHE